MRMVFITNRNFFCYVFFLSFFFMVPTLYAHIGEFDEYWLKRAEEALRVRNHTYNPNPLEVTNHFNHHVNKIKVPITDSTNSTSRRSLMKRYRGPCLATNPIDQCWRCRSDWANDRKRLADCALGFGRLTTGGKEGRFYIVTDSSDDDLLDPRPGTLRHAVIQDEPLWIIFARSMFIKLQQELIMTGDKTIDGRGANVHIAYGAGITIQFVKNVIIHGIHIHEILSLPGGIIRDSVHHYGLRTRSDGDGISVFGSSNVWIDHVSMDRCADGLIDVTMGSTGVTISNSHFTYHNEALLLGAFDTYSDDKNMQVTIAFNHFGKGLVQRMPRCRFGFFHVVNNDYTHWLMYAIGGSSNPTILSQGNRFIAPQNAFCKEVTKRESDNRLEWQNWQWKSEGDLMINGAMFNESGPPMEIKPFSPEDLIQPKPGTYAATLTLFAGARLKCVRNKPC